MKRLLVKLVVFLLLGAIVNVAVAWGIARWASPSKDRMLDAMESGRLFERRGMVYRLLTINPALELSGIGFRSRFAVGGAELPSTTGDHPEGSVMLYAFEAGWPSIALSSEWRWSSLGNAPMTRTLHAGWETPLSDIPSSNLSFVSLNLPFALPLLPIWPGFAINSVFYAMILWLLFAAPFALRRRRRIRRGLCPACAYPVGESAVCTECGRPFPPPLRAGARGRVGDTSSRKAVSSTHPLAPSLMGGGNDL